MPSPGPMQVGCRHDYNISVLMSGNAMHLLGNALIDIAEFRRIPARTF